MYIARVLGAVSWQQHTVDAPLYYNTERRVAGVDAGQGKPSVTEFRLLYVEEDGLTSVVECRYGVGEECVVVLLRMQCFGIISHHHTCSYAYTHTCSTMSLHVHKQY